MLLYADDTVIYCHNSNLQELEKELNEDLLIIAKWLNDNKLTINLEKTKCMLMGSNRKLRNAKTLLVSISNYEISNVNCFKYLGVILSNDLKWSDHIDYLTAKINQRSGLLRRIIHLLPFKARVLFNKDLVLPLFDYADIVWGEKINSTLMDKLQTMKDKAAKIILNEPLYSSASEALARLNWITLKQRRFYHSCLLIYKCINSYTYHSMDLLTIGESHGYNTRNRDNLRLPAWCYKKLG